VAVHARSASGRRRPPAPGRSRPRNLIGFRDGTNDLKAESEAGLDRVVWVGDGDSGADWLAGGSCLVTRSIRMIVEPWDTSTLDEQHRTIGRTEGSGAPLGPGELARVPGAPDELGDGDPAARRQPRGRLRRAGPAGRGPVFIAYQRDPVTGVVRVQGNLRLDAMNEYIRRTSSPVFACPPGIRGDDDWWGRALAPPDHGLVRARARSAAAAPGTRRVTRSRPPPRNNGRPAGDHHPGLRMCRPGRVWTPWVRGTPTAGLVQQSDVDEEWPPWSNQDDGAWATGTSSTR
jgi:deferrochelatase/peroxidase EfeB